jgi:hypothetical protein
LVLSSRRAGIQRAVSGSTKSGSQARGTAEGTTEGWIKSAIHSLLQLDDDADTSVLQHDELLRIAKTKFPCYVVHAVHSMSFREGTNSTRDHTYWIEKGNWAGTKDGPLHQRAGIG